MKLTEIMDMGQRISADWVRKEALKITERRGIKPKIVDRELAKETLEK